MFKHTPEEQLKILKQGCVDIVSEAEILEKLKKAYKDNKPLKIKLGMDPSRPDLHLGHVVVLNKLRVWQQMGHEVYFLIGDFTAMIGDPTGKNETRPALTKEEVKENSKTYARQVFKVLDPEMTKVVYNSHWMDEMSSSDMIRLAGQYTVARMLERDDFHKRFNNEQSICVHEFLYPLVQAYDSVALHSDVELGGTDQRFNLLVGRDIQKAYNQKPQCIMTMPILEGLDGVQKMSKSLNNYIAIEDSPQDMFGKTMRLSDELMVRYYELLTDIRPEELQSLKEDLKSGKKHPKEAKVDLGKYFVELFYSKEEAEIAASEFEKVFKQKSLPTNMPEHSVEANPEKWICQLISELKMASSNSEARRLVQGRAVEWDEKKVEDANTKLELKSGSEHILKVGKKKFAKIKVI
ncbi:MAG: tyrosine--tRNA ligase [Bdellovibrionales bacterium]|nr:tyrosine--tRNA ligase [Bdellovibrionales bacterium]